MNTAHAGSLLPRLHSSQRTALAVGGRRLVERFVDGYNDRRLHSANGYVTPADKLAGREQAIFDVRDCKLAEARERKKIYRQMPS